MTGLVVDLLIEFSLVLLTTFVLVALLRLVAHEITVHMAQIAAATQQRFKNML